MPAVDVRLKVIDDPDKRLASLKQGMRNRILRKAVRAAAAPIRKAMKRMAPRRSGATAASISVRIATHRRTGAIYAIIGPRRRFRFRRKGKKVISNEGPTRIAHLLAKGVRPHSLRSGDTLRRIRGGRTTAHRQRAGRLHPGHKANRYVQLAGQVEGQAAVAKMRHVIALELARLDAKRAGAAGGDGG